MPHLGTAAASADPVVGETLRVQGLHKRFGDTVVLDDVGLEVRNGGIVALLGPSGCGKTTLLRSIAGLERPDSGSVSVGNRLLSASGPGQRTVFVPPERRRVGMVFQDWALFPHLSVARNVGYGLTRAERRGKRVAEALDLVDLAGMGDRMPATLSGGQQQRVALARALAHRPSVILLDEPFSNLDAALRTQIRVDVGALLRSLSMTAVFVTHDQEEALVLGDEVAVLLGGRVVQQATPAQLYDSPASRAVAAFVGDANFLAGHAAGWSATTSVGPVPLRSRARGAVDVLLRPEELQVTQGRGARVEAVEYYGHDAVYRVRVLDGAMVRARVMSPPQFSSGDEVAVTYAGEPTLGYEQVAGR